MPRPWTVIESVETEEGPLELRRRDDRDYLITIKGRVLMTSMAHRSELVLGDLGCERVKKRTAPCILLAGLGMGYTLRGALDALPDDAKVTVVELNPVVERWCRGPIKHLSGAALDDPRVELISGDVMDQARKGVGCYDAIVLDLYEGPNNNHHPVNDPFYGTKAIAQLKAALKPKGTLAVWSEQSDRPYELRLA